MRTIAACLMGLILPLVAHSADVDAGRAKAQACTACHGGNGVSVNESIPNLAGQKIAYIISQLKAFRAGTRKNPLMNAMAVQLSDADIDNVAAFFNSLGTPLASETSAVGKQLAASKIIFPTDYRETFKLYSKVNQAEQKRVRHNFANSTTLQRPDSQGPLPDGAFVLTEIYAAKLDDKGNPMMGDDGFFVADKLLALAAMEKRQGWGDDIPAELRNGDWNYALFTPEKTPKKGANQAACLACHKPLSDADYLFSYEALVGKAQ